MRPFKFQLDRLKRFRSAQEQAARATFGAAMTALTEAEAAHRSALERRDAARAELRQILASGGSASAFLAAQSVTDRLAQFAQSCGEACTQRSAAVDQARTEWLSVRSKEEGLKRLHSSRQSEHRRETERLLARELDEVAMTRAAGSGKPVGTPSTATDLAS